jgi:signal transduction histidine kinase
MLPASNTTVDALEMRLGNATGSHERIDAMNDLAWALWRIDAARARELASTALELSRRSDRDGAPYQRGIGYSLRALGWHELSLSNFDAALEYSLDAAGILETVNDRFGLADALNTIGLVYWSLGDYARGLEHLLRSSKLRQEIGSRNGQASSLNNIGAIHTTLGEFSQALDYYLRSLKLQQELGSDSGEAIALGNIGEVYLRLGDPHKGLEYLEQSLEIVRRVGDHAAEADVLNCIGEAYHMLGALDLALENYTASNRISAAHGFRSAESVSLKNMGRLHLSRGESRHAVELLEQALAIAVELKTRPLVQTIHHELATARRQMGDLCGAIDNLEESFRIREEVLGGDSEKKIRMMLAEQNGVGESDRAELERLREEEFRRTLEELRQSQTQLMQSEKMASLGQLTAGIAHEINNPINFVAGNIGSLRRDVDEVIGTLARYVDRVRELGLENEFAEAEEHREEIQMEDLIEEIGLLISGIEEGASRTAEIVKGLRNFSRADEGALKMADLNEGLDSTLILLRSKFFGRIEVERIYGEIPLVECYAGQINQVFMNLIANAVQAIEGEGKIRIVTECYGDCVRIRIRDTGPGMPADVREKIFDPFFTTKKAGEGTGLGLSICNRIVRRHSGTLSVESEPGNGTEFIVTLPVSQTGFASSAA